MAKAVALVLLHESVVCNLLRVTNQIPDRSYLCTYNDRVALSNQSTCHRLKNLSGSRVRKESGSSQMNFSLL